MMGIGSGEGIRRIVDIGTFRRLRADFAIRYTLVLAV
jgi:hypothetical protein